MIRKEIDEKIIAEVTNLSLEEIEKIKEEVGNGTRIWTKKIEKLWAIISQLYWGKLWIK